MQNVNFKSAANVIAGAAMLVTASVGGASAQQPVRNTPQQQTQDLNQEQCNLVRNVIVRVVQDVGSDTISDDFKQSLRAFIGENRDCRGTRVIYAPEGRDIDAYNVMRVILGSGTPPIALERNPGLVVRLSRAPARQ